MMLNRTSPENKLTRALDAVRRPLSAWRRSPRLRPSPPAVSHRPVEPQDPRTNNVYVDQIRQTAVDKIDLLFMIDNSISMADKQEILERRRAGARRAAWSRRTASTPMGSPTAATPTPTAAARRASPSSSRSRTSTSASSPRASAATAARCAPTPRLQPARSTTTAQLWSRRPRRRCRTCEQPGLLGLGSRPGTHEHAARRRPTPATLIAALHRPRERDRRDGLRLRGVARGLVSLPDRSRAASERSTQRHERRPSTQARRRRRRCSRSARLPAPRLAGRDRHADRRERLLDHRRAARAGWSARSRTAARRSRCRAPPAPAPPNPNDACCRSCASTEPAAARGLRGARRRRRVRQGRLAHGRRRQPEPALLRPEAPLRLRLALPDAALRRRPDARRRCRDRDGHAGAEPALHAAQRRQAGRATRRWCSSPASSACPGRTSPTDATLRRAAALTLHDAPSELDDAAAAGT